MPNTGSTQISWNANTESDLTGYRLYVGRASGVYNVAGSPVSLGLVTTTAYNVNAAGAWFFALTALNSSGQESGFSNEITDTFTVPAAPDARALIGIM